MLFKSKLLISLASIGISSGTGVGIYYGVNKSKNDRGEGLKGKAADANLAANKGQNDIVNGEETPPSPTQKQALAS